MEWRTSTKSDHPGKLRPWEGLCWMRTGPTVNMEGILGCFRRRIGIFQDSAAWQIGLVKHHMKFCSFAVLALNPQQIACQESYLLSLLKKTRKSDHFQVTSWSYHSPQLILLRLWVFFLSRIRMNHPLHGSLYWFSSNWIQTCSYSNGRSTLYEATQSIPAVPTSIKICWCFPNI